MNAAAFDAVGSNRKRKWRAGVIGVALVVCGTAAALVPHHPAQAAGRAPVVVGQVVSVGGSNLLFHHRHGSHGPLVPLVAGASLVFGEDVVPGQGVTATLTLTRPQGVSTDAILVNIVPVAQTSHLVTSSRNSDGSVSVKIG